MVMGHEQIATRIILELSEQARYKLHDPDIKPRMLSDGGTEVVWDAREVGHNFLFRHRVYGTNPFGSVTMISAKRVHEHRWRNIWLTNSYGKPTKEFYDLSRTSGGTMIKIGEVMALIRRAGREGLWTPIQRPGRIVSGELELLSELEVGSTDESFRGELRVNLLRQDDTSPLLYTIQTHGGRIN